MNNWAFYILYKVYKSQMYDYDASHILQGPRGKPGPKGEKGEHGSNVSACFKTYSFEATLCIIYYYSILY